MMGDYFHLLPDGGQNKILGFTFFFFHLCRFRWSQNLTDAFGNGQSLLVYKRKIYFVREIFILCSYGAYFVCLLSKEDNIEQYVPKQNISDRGMFCFLKVHYCVSSSIWKMNLVLFWSTLKYNVFVHYNKKKNMQQDCHMHIMQIKHKLKFCKNSFIYRFITWFSDQCT